MQKSEQESLDTALDFDTGVNGDLTIERQKYLQGVWNNMKVPEKMLKGSECPPPKLTVAVDVGLDGASTHNYSLSQSPRRLGEWASDVAAMIKESGISPVLVYSGMSGVSAATALSLALHPLGVNYHMCYIRKENEVSHGVKIEHTFVGWDDKIPEGFTLVFVDDFISSGTTMKYCIDSLGVWAGCRHKPLEVSMEYAALQKPLYEDLFGKVDKGNYRVFDEDAE